MHYLRTKFGSLHSLPSNWHEASVPEVPAAAFDAASPAAAAAAHQQQQRQLLQRSTSLGALRSTLLLRLPRTAAWVQRAALAAPAIQQYLATAGQLDLDAPDVHAAANAAAKAALAAAAVPATLRAGLRAGPSATPSGGGGAAAARTSGSGAATAVAGASSPASSPAVAGEAGVAVAAGGAAAPPAAQLPAAPPRSWRSLVRTGLVALVSSDRPAVGPALAETLAWDAERLHAAQNSFQQLAVATAGLLLVAQTRARAGRPPLPPQEQAAARRRVLVVLADPSMNLGSLVSELHRLCTMGGGASPNEGAGDAVADEAALGAAFRALMNPSSAAFTSISNALAGSLAVHLLLGGAAVAADAGGAGRAVAALLGRVGAGALAGEVAALAGRLARVCGMTERVFAPAYEVLLAPALAPPGSG